MVGRDGLWGGSRWICEVALDGGGVLVDSDSSGDGCL